MKELLLQFAAYNLWANQLFGERLISLPAEKQTQTVASSFDSLLKTVVHMWDAEAIWWQRLKLQERIVVPSATFTGNMKEAFDNLLKQDRQWKEWVEKAQEHMLQYVFVYQNSKNETFKQPVSQMLLHLFNHNTYHRGQLVTILRQLEGGKIPQTDFIVWSRKN